MRIGIVVAQDYWLHFQDIYSEFNRIYQTSVFKQRKWPYQLMSSRINRFLLNLGLKRFMQNNDVTFFEWSEHQFVTATHLPKSSIIATRLHSHELWDFAPQANWENVGLVILVSHAMQRKFLELFPGMESRTRIVHNGVSIHKYSPTNSAFKGRIGTLSRIEPYKRIEGLVIVLSILRKEGFDLFLDIGGTSTEPRYQRYDYELKNLVKRLHLEPFVFFRGQISNTPEWFRSIDIFVTNSISEGMQVALLEAMASGCNCLSFNWDGVEEALPQKNIYFSENQLIEKIIAYVNEDEETKHQIKALMRDIVVEKFNIEERNQDIIRYIEAINY
jgi:glycosyltransferase involved in cell wall biosynthesis